MSASRSRDGSLAVAEFSARAVSRIRRLGIDVTEFFAPLAKLFHSISSQLSYGFLAMEAGRRLGILSLTRVRLVPPAAWFRRGDAKPVEAYEQPSMEVPNVALMFHVSIASKLASGVTRTAVGERSVLQSGQAALAPLRSGGEAQSRMADAGGAPAELSEFGGAQRQLPALSLLAGAALPALALGRIAIPIIGVRGAPQSATVAKGGRVAGVGGSAGAEALSRHGAAVGKAADASIIQPAARSSALATEMVSPDADRLVPRTEQAQLEGAEGGGHVARAAGLPEGAGLVTAAGQPFQAGVWAAFAPLMAAVKRANLAASQQATVRGPATPRTAPARAGKAAAGTHSDGAMPYRSAEISDALLAMVALQRGLSASMPSFSAIRGGMGRLRQAVLKGDLRVAAHSGVEPEMVRPMAPEVEEPTFGDRLGGISGWGAQALQQRHIATSEASASEERAYQALDRMRRPELKVEPVFDSKAAQPSVNIEVGAYSEEDLQELERKVERILQDQVRRFYGMI